MFETPVKLSFQKVTTPSISCEDVSCLSQMALLPLLDIFFQLIGLSMDIVYNICIYFMANNSKRLFRNFKKQENLCYFHAV